MWQTKAMTTDLATTDNTLPVLMKSKIVHWVTPDTHVRIQQQLQSQGAHTFMRISELGVTINTSEIEGAYTREQYEDLMRMRAGMTQCIYRRWHGRKEDCDCRERIRRETTEATRERQQLEDNRPLTEEERAHNLKRIQEIRKSLRKKISLR